MATLDKMKTKFSSRVIDHLIQALLIFASVFLAFWLTEYRDSQIKNEAFETSMFHIASEMEFNHNRIEYVFDYYNSLLWQIDSIKKIPNSNWENLYGYQLKNWQGVQLPMLRSSAYQTFLNTGISDKAKFELAKSFADIYSLQSMINIGENSFYDLAINDPGFTALYKIRHFMGIYYEILPDLMMFYQDSGKKWLSKYGYDLEIKSNRLRIIVESKMISH